MRRSAEIYGVEANFDVELFENFNVRAGGTWLHARYGDGFLFDGLSVNPDAAGSNTNSDPLKTFLNVSGLTADLSGKQMSRAPDLAAYAGFDYLIPMGDGGLRFAANSEIHRRLCRFQPVDLWRLGRLGHLDRSRLLCCSCGHSDVLRSRQGRQ